MAGDIVPHNALVVVSDARKALFLRNTADAFKPRLKVLEAVEAPANPATHAQGSDRPGHVPMDARRSSYDETDLHEQAEVEFSTQVARRLEDMCRSEETGEIVLIAPPRTLAVLRKSLHASVVKKIVGEHAKDLVHRPVAEIEAWLAAVE